METSSRTVDMMLRIAAAPFVALIGGMFAEGIIMMAVTANRRRTGYVELATGFRGTWRRIFPPPPGTSDPRPLQIAYKVASYCVSGGLIGIGLMAACVAAIFIFTRGQ